VICPAPLIWLNLVRYQFFLHYILHYKGGWLGGLFIDYTCRWTAGKRRKASPLGPKRSTGRKWISCISEVREKPSGALFSVGRAHILSTSFRAATPVAIGSAASDSAAERWIMGYVCHRIGSKNDRIVHHRRHYRCSSFLHGRVKVLILC